MNALTQLRELFSRLTPRQSITLGVAVVALLGGLFWTIQSRRNADYKLLFRDMAPEEAGQLTARLKEKNVDFRIGEDGASIYVRSAQVNELRLDLAAAGLPRTGRIGFEIFDKTNFALTEFAEQVNYQRALEGELERTLGGLKEVEHARIHLTFAKASIFAESRQPAKASVVLRLKQGAKLTPASAGAISFLLASSVESLAPENVSILDQNGNLLSRPRKSLTADEEFPEILLEYRQKLERDLLAKVNTTLTPLLGEDHYRAGITVECDMTSGEASEEVYDPEKAVVTSEQKTEDTSGIPVSAGVPGTPSSLPRPVTKPASLQTSSQRKTESTNYQASRSIRRTKIPQGQIKRISLSVLLDQNMRWEGVGQKARRVFEPPSPEKIKTIKDVIAGAVGLVADRGDQVIVESLPFDATLRIPAPEAPIPPAPPKPIIEIPEPILKNLPPQLRDPNILLAVLAGAVLGFLLLLLAVFWFLRKRKKVAKAKAAAAAKAAEAIEAADAAAAKAELGEEDGKSFGERMAEQQNVQKRLEEQELAKLRFPELTTQKSKLLIQHITEEAEKDPLMIAQILRSWLQQEYKEKR